MPNTRAKLLWRMNRRRIGKRSPLNPFWRSTYTRKRIFCAKLCKTTHFSPNFECGQLFWQACKFIHTMWPKGHSRTQHTRRWTHNRYTREMICISSLSRSLSHYRSSAVFVLTDIANFLMDL